MKNYLVKYWWQLMLGLFILLLIPGCKKEEAINVEDRNKGAYVQRADGARLFAGYNRAVIAWRNTDNVVSLAKLYWNNRKDSVIAEVKPGTDSVKIALNNLPEGDCHFEILTYDKNNVNSGKALVSGFVFGPLHSAKTKNRTPANLTYLDEGALSTEWQKMDTVGALGTEIRYIDANGAEQMQFIKITDSLFTLNNIGNAIRGTVKFRTAYAPGQYVIDTLYSGFNTLPYINRKAYFDSLPGWKFRCKVMVESRTVQLQGGALAFKAKMDEAIEKAGKRFQVPGINNDGGNKVYFYMTAMEQFSGNSSQYTTKQWVNDNSLDLMLVVNDNATATDDSWGWRRAPYLTLGHDYDGLFGDAAVDALLHEFGHVRGMYDLYLGEVTASKNPINGKDYESVKCIMNYPYGGETVWSEFSKIIINASAGNRIAKPYWEFFPKVFSVNVKRKNNTAAVGAQLKFYPVIQTSTGNEVRATDVVQFRNTLGSTGVYIFDPANPFAVNQEPSNNIYNFLVEVIYTLNNVEYKEYSWMPMNDALISGSKGLSYELKIVLTR